MVGGAPERLEHDGDLRGEVRPIGKQPADEAVVEAAAGVGKADVVTPVHEEERFGRVGAREGSPGVADGIDEEIVVALQDQERHGDGVEVPGLEEARRRRKGYRSLDTRLAETLVVCGDEGREGAARVSGEADALSVDATGEAVSGVAREAEERVNHEGHIARLCGDVGDRRPARRVEVGEREVWGGHDVAVARQVGGEERRSAAESGVAVGKDHQRKVP